MSRVIVLGRGGQLARAFCELLEQRSTPYELLGQEDLDLSKPEQLSLEVSKGDLLINCAAYTQVDAAETEEELATLVNGHAVGRLSRICEDRGARLIHFSTDYVFDGQANRPYPVDTARHPVNAYGRSKAKGEELMSKYCPSGLLIRTSWVYAPWGNNFVRTMARLMAEKDSLRIVHDQRGRPTHVLGLAQRTLELAERGCEGVFHVTDEGECSWFEFAQSIAASLGSDCKLEPCTTEEFPRPASRPAYSVLDIEKTNEILGPARHYGDWIRTCVEHGM